jgi:hypothetical protein
MPMRRSKSPTSNVLQNPAQEQGQQRKLMSVFCGELPMSVPKLQDLHSGKYRAAGGDAGFRVWCQTFQRLEFGD